MESPGNGSFCRQMSTRRLLGGVLVVGGSLLATSSCFASPLVPIKCKDGTFVIPWSTPSRADQIKRLKSEGFDMVVIGGGCVGAGVALDASFRGLNTALIEADDFGSGTSGRSTKLIHGGVRYLEQAFKKLDYKSFLLVQEALRERNFMISSAPYMAYPIPIMVPIYSLWKVPYYWIGAKVYDLVAGSKSMLPTSHFMSKEEAQYAFPMLNDHGLKGAIVYYDGAHNDTRMNLSIVLTAAQQGAVTINHCRVISFIKGDKNNITGCRVKDCLSNEEFDVKAKCVVNATGPFCDSIRKMDNPSLQHNLVIPSAGVHVILADHFSPDKMGLIVPETTDGRVLFFLPWEGMTICGTTDAECDISDLPMPTEEDVDFILAESSRFLKTEITRFDVKAAWSGIRPLVRDLTRPDTKTLTRTHFIDISESGLVTIVGGKWTTYRQMAEDTVNECLKTNKGLHRFALKQCATLDIKMIGADRQGIVCSQNFDRIVVTLREAFNIDRECARYLVRNYGTRALQVAQIANKGNGHPQRLYPKYPFLEAEIMFAVEQEYACTVVDVISRRMRLAFIDTRATLEVLPAVIKIMSNLLHWDKQRCRKEEDDAKKFIASMHFHRDDNADKQKQ